MAEDGNYGMFVLKTFENFSPSLICVIAFVFVRQCKFQGLLFYGIYVSELSSSSFSGVRKT